MARIERTDALYPHESRHYICGEIVHDIMKAWFDELEMEDAYGVFLVLDAIDEKLREIADGKEKKIRYIFGMGNECGRRRVYFPGLNMALALKHMQMKAVFIVEAGRIKRMDGEDMLWQTMDLATSSEAVRILWDDCLTIEERKVFEMKEV